nr:hypothetical protein [uncultured Desulfobacter sp.]
MSSKQNDTRYEVILDLKGHNDTQVLRDSNEIVQQELKNAFDKKIEKALHKACDYKKNLEANKNALFNWPPNRVHDTITISGGRGSGKTTFILNMFHWVKKEIKDRIEFLEILDPTLIEEKDHVFVNIISRIKQRVDKKNLERSPDDQRGGQYRDWQESLRKLASGLPAIEGIGGNIGMNSDTWKDPVYVLERGLKTVSSANSLELNFHRFVANSLNFLCKDAFVLAFDDIDTNFSSGWPVLEVLRKYLTTPQLITVLAGDFELYSKLIRKQQWDNFGNQLLDIELKELKWHSQYTRVVDRLEEQYFLKLLKAENRMRIKTVFSIAQDKKINLVFKTDEPKEAKAFVRDFCIEKLFLNNDEDIDLYTRALLSNPIRSILQLFKIDEEASPSDDVILERFIDIFWALGEQREVGIDSLKERDPRILLNVLLGYLVDWKRLEQGYRFKPEFASQRVNNTMVAGGCILSNTIKKHPHLVFEYFIKFGFTREAALQLPYEQETRNAPSIHDFLRRTGINEGETAVHIARMGIGYMLAAHKTIKGSGTALRPHSWMGTFSIGSLAETAKGAKKEKGEKYRIDTLQDMVNSWHNPFITLMVSRNIDQNNVSAPVASIFNLIAIVGEMVRLTDGSDNEKVSIAKISDQLRRYSQIRDYPLPSWDVGGFTIVKGSSDDSNADDDETKKSFDDGSICREIYMWIKNKPEDIQLPVHILGKMTTRFLYTLSNMDSQVASYPLGEKIHRAVIAFYNSVMVEEALQIGEQPTRLTNPIDKDKNFNENFKCLASKIDKLPLTRWILYCPILRAYLNDPKQYSEPIANHLSDFDYKISENQLGKGLEGETLYELLNRIYIPNLEVNFEEAAKKWANKKTESKATEMLKLNNQALIDNFNDLKEAKEYGKIPKNDSEKGQQLHKALENRLSEFKKG